MLSRRGFLSGLLAAPVIIRTPGLLMPIKPLPLSLGGTALLDLGRDVSIVDRNGELWSTASVDEILRDVNDLFRRTWDVAVRETDQLWV